MKYSHIFFDLDRTIWDFDKNTIETLTDLYNLFNLRLYFNSFNDFYKVYKPINDKQWDLYRNKQISKDELRKNRFYLTFLEAGLDDEKLAEVFGYKYLEATPLKTALYDGSHEILAYLKIKYPLYILTNGFKEVQIKKIKVCNLEQYFTRVFTSEEVGVQKPNADFFNYVLNKVNVNAENCIMIGDDLKVDIIGAKSVGIDTVFYNHNKKPINDSVDYVISSLYDLKKIL